MPVNPLLIKTIKKSQRAILDYKKTPEGKADLRPEKVENYVRRKFTNVQKQNFYNRPKQLQFLAMQGTKLNLMMLKHKELLTVQKKMVKR